MKKEERNKITQVIAKREEYGKQVLSAALELELDEVVNAERIALERLERELNRRLNSPKRKMTVEEVLQKAEAARQNIKVKTMNKIARLKMKAGVILA